MFLLKRPTRREIERFIDRSHGLPLSYGPTGIVRHRPAVKRFDDRWSPSAAVKPISNGFWSLNGARVLYHVGGTNGQDAFGFAYGTLTNHAESGEELFEAFIDRQTGDVMYRIRAVSRPQSPLTWIGQPIVRVLQARFRRDSAIAMRRATCARS